MTTKTLPTNPRGSRKTRNAMRHDAIALEHALAEERAVYDADPTGGSPSNY